MNIQLPDSNAFWRVFERYKFAQNYEEYTLHIYMQLIRQVNTEQRLVNTPAMFKKNFKFYFSKITGLRKIQWSSLSKLILNEAH